MHVLNLLLHGYLVHTIFIHSASLFTHSLARKTSLDRSWKVPASWIKIVCTQNPCNNMYLLHMIRRFNIDWVMTYGLKLSSTNKVSKCKVRHHTQHLKLTFYYCLENEQLQRKKFHSNNNSPIFTKKITWYSKSIRISIYISAIYQLSIYICLII